MKLRFKKPQKAGLKKILEALEAADAALDEIATDFVPEEDEEYDVIIDIQLQVHKAIEGIQEII